VIALAVALGRDPVGSLGAGKVREAREMVGAVLLNGGMTGDSALQCYD